MKGSLIKCVKRKSEFFSKYDYSLFVSFRYNEQILYDIKNCAKRHFNFRTKEWELPYENETELFINDLQKKYLLQANNDSNHNIFNYKKQDKSDIFKLIELPNLHEKIKLYEHQKEVIKYGIYKNSFLLGDEMGLGKTAAIIHYSLYKKQYENYNKCLIITGINSLKYNWQIEIEKHSNATGYILGTKIKKNGHKTLGGSKKIIEDLHNINNIDGYFIITNIESIRNKNILKAIQNCLINNQINMICIDEAQCLRSYNSIQSKNIISLKARTKIAMTGTPIMNKPIELYTIFRWLGLDNHSFYEFRNHYCEFGGYNNYEIVAYKNIHEIQKLLDLNMLRRLKTEVLDLPNKIYTTELLEMNNKQLKIYEEVKEQIQKNITEVILSPNPLAKLIRLRQATATTELLNNEIHESVKFDRLGELLEELKLNNKKAVVFSNWESVISKCFNLFKSKYNISIITGKLEEYQRQTEIGDFRIKNDFIFGTVGALGTGYTLTEADTVIFLDSPWNSAMKEQACDRVHRIGQKNTCNIITLVCKDTMDEKIEDLIYKKKMITDLLIDNVNDFNKMDKNKLVDYLIS